jgi:hypothetical protein
MVSAECTLARRYNVSKLTPCPGGIAGHPSGVCGLLAGGQRIAMVGT